MSPTNSSSGRRRGSSLALLVVGLALLSTGCRGCTDKPVAPFPESTPLTDREKALGAGDVIEIRVYGEPDLSGIYDANADGTINFPLIGSVAVVDRLPGEVQQEIQARLADGYLKKPSVAVRVTEYKSKKVTVNGQVRQPGTLSYTDNMSILEAISRAGGFTAMARKNAVKVTRLVQGKSKVIIVAVDEIGKGRAPNFLMHPGDNVLVEERPY
jgi:polysaccharide export outer membrane protein